MDPAFTSSNAEHDEVVAWIRYVLCRPSYTFQHDQALIASIEQRWRVGGQEVHDVSYIVLSARLPENLMDLSLHL